MLAGVYRIVKVPRLGPVKTKGVKESQSYRLSGLEDLSEYNTALCLGCYISERANGYLWLRRFDENNMFSSSGSRQESHNVYKEKVN